MGVVLAAVDPRSGARLAVKLLAAEASRETRERFEVEFQAQRRVQHPAVARVLDRGLTEAGHPYLVFERFVGESLADRLRRGPLAEREAAELVAELAEGVTACHAVGVLHRDLKPENVMLTAAGPRLIDFGLALEQDASERLTRTGVLIGTPGYWAPELIRGEKGGAGVATDVYGLGALLYACLTARPPHSALSVQELVERSTRSPDPPSTHVPGLAPELDALCMACLTSEPSERLDSALTVAERLRAWTPGKIREPQRRSATAAIGVGAVLLVGVGGLALWAVAPGGGTGESIAPSPPPDSAALRVLAERVAAERDACRYAEAEALLAEADRSAGGALPPALAFEAVCLDVVRRRNPAALAALESLADRCEGELAVRCQALIALAAVRDLRWDESAAAEQAALRAAPNDWLVWRLLGDVAHERARLVPDRSANELAAERYARAVEAGDPSPTTRAQLALLQLRSVDGSLRRERWRELATEFPSGLACLELANCLAYLEPRDWAGALRWVERALEAAPDDPAVVVKVGGCYASWLQFHRTVDEAKLARAEALLERGLALAPDDPWVASRFSYFLRILGECLLANERRVEGSARIVRARDLMRRFLGRYPGSYLSRLELVEGLKTLEGPDQALQALAPLLRAHPEQAVLHYHRFTILMQLGRNEEALEEIEEALRLAPEREDFRNLRDHLRHRLGR